MADSDIRCPICGTAHPLVIHDEDCERRVLDDGECICGDHVLGNDGYVSVDVACIDDATETHG